jgi:hypothetical protein
MMLRSFLKNAARFSKNYATSLKNLENTDDWLAVGQYESDRINELEAVYAC